jgi:plasmid stabilization system protein ParE
VTFRLVLERSAQLDVDDAVAYLAARAPEQVVHFVDDLEMTFAGIAENPMLMPEARPGVRVRGMTVFPYGVWYRVFPGLELAEVVAVLHHRRGPDALAKRAPS